MLRVRAGLWIKFCGAFRLELDENAEPMPMHGCGKGKGKNQGGEGGFSETEMERGALQRGALGGKGELGECSSSSKRMSVRSLLQL